MALRAETLAEINRRAQRIRDEQARKIAKEKEAKARFEAHKTRIKDGLIGLNKQIAEDTEIQQALALILFEKDGYKTFPDPEGISPLKGLAISKSGIKQLAVMTPKGLQIVEEGIEHKLGLPGDKHNEPYSEQVFKPVNFDDANLFMLFPGDRFPLEELSDAILNTALRAPNKK